MSLSPDDFLKQLEEHGVLAADQSRTIHDGNLLDALPKDTEGLAQELVRQGKLTQFQADEARRGNARSLVLGNYVLLEKIGAGGMGQVFKARHQVMDRVVALKLLPAAMTRDSAAIARFHREVRAAAKLSHPNIVTAYDADQADGVHFLVMEYVDGCDLSALVRRGGPLSLDRAVNFVQQAAKGLEAAHRKGIVHRDIKPANLLLDSEGVVKILDMGLARIDQTDGPVQEELTNTGTIMGTVDYMAPEQALDTKTADARADIYALGCSLYFLLTGKQAYQGDTPMKKLLAHREQPIPSLRATRPEIPEQLETIFRRMMAKKVEDRYQTMGELNGDLGRCPGILDSLPTIRDFTSLQIEQSVTQTVSQQLSFEPTLLTVAPAPVTKVKPSGGGRKKGMLIGGGLLAIATLAVLIAIANKDGAKTRTEDPGEAQVEIPRQPETVVARTVDETGLLAYQKPGFDLWVREVQAKPAQEQLDAVSKKLVELNRGFDGKVTGWEGQPPDIGDGVVSRVTIVTDNVTDISPVSAFAGLEKLALIGSSQGSGKLHDLSPLKGMKLTNITCRNNPALSDLSPLSESPLAGLDCFGTGVADLSAISDRKLTYLDATGTKVVDLAPLKGMPLEFLEFWNTNVSDLAPLQGMPLRALHMDNVPAGNLAPLEGMPLTDLRTGSGVTDLAPLRGMKLVSLTFNGPVDDLSPLEGMPLKHLSCIGIKVSDLSPIRGMKLATLSFSGSVADLSPLEGMPLTELSCFHTNVKDLSPIKGMKLTSLNIDHAPISDLSAVEGMPLEIVSLANSKVSDLSPLRGMSLTAIVFTPRNITTGMDALRQMASLKSIGVVPWDIKSADEFWKKYDAGEFDEPITDFDSPAFRQWITEVRALPAENQSEAVSRKLMELNPGFDGRLTGGGGSAHIHEGVVKTLGFFTDNVTDISPVRAFRELDCLDIRGSSPGSGKLRDLSPLKGMRLPHVICNCNPNLSDLSPLKDLPLTNLECNNTGVSDLSPISALKLTNLDVTLTKVADLTPLKEMPLEYLLLQNTQVSDISPLQGLPLRMLLMDNTTVRDLSPLNGMPLTTLQTGMDATDLTPLQGLKLKFLTIGGPVTDLSPLQGMPLTSLSCSCPDVSDLSPLKGMKLTSLIFIGPISDLSVIEGMPLEKLELVHTKVSDLAPLRGMKLKHLNVIGSPVTDLSVIEGMPLESLLLTDTGVSDLSPVRDLKLTSITFTPGNITKGIDLLRQMDSINTIGIRHWEMKSPAEFWKKYDAGEFDEPKSQ